MLIVDEDDNRKKKRTIRGDGNNIDIRFFLELKVWRI